MDNYKYKYLKYKYKYYNQKQNIKDSSSEYYMLYLFDEEVNKYNDILYCINIFKHLNNNYIIYTIKDKRNNDLYELLLNNFNNNKCVINNNNLYNLIYTKNIKNNDYENQIKDITNNKCKDDNKTYNILIIN